MDRQHFPGISSDAFISDLDRHALAGLKKIPLLPVVVKKFHELGLDRWMYAWNMANSVRCGPKQYATLFDILNESARVLDMSPPELYVTSNPYPNAFAGGVERPYITVRSSMIEALTDEQLFHLMGHELGHIKAGHILYFSVASTLIPLLEALGQRTFGIGDAVSMGLVLAFYEWSRAAELSADRAGLLCSQNFETSAGALLAMASGPSRLSHEQNLEAFLDQSRTYQDMSGADALGKILVQSLYGLTTTHPMPVYRLQALERWHAAGSMSQIMDGRYQKV